MFISVIKKKKFMCLWIGLLNISWWHTNKERRNVTQGCSSSCWNLMVLVVLQCVPPRKSHLMANLWWGRKWNKGNQGSNGFINLVAMVTFVGRCWVSWFVGFTLCCGQFTDVLTTAIRAYDSRTVILFKHSNNHTASCIMYPSSHR